MIDDNPPPTFDDRTMIERQQLRQEIARLNATIDEVLGRLADTQHLAADLREERDIARVENARTCRLEAELRLRVADLMVEVGRLRERLHREGIKQ